MTHSDWSCSRGRLFNAALGNARFRGPDRDADVPCWRTSCSISGSLSAAPTKLGLVMFGPGVCLGTFLSICSRWRVLIGEDADEVMKSLLLEDVLGFWFDECFPRDWFKKDAGFDSRLAKRFRALVEEAFSGGLEDWCETADGWLAHTCAGPVSPWDVPRHAKGLRWRPTCPCPKSALPRAWPYIAGCPDRPSGTLC